MRYILILIISLLVSFKVHTQSFLMQISGNGLKKPAYLFGTIHLISKKGDIPVYEKAKEKLVKCKAFAMEVKPDDMPSPSIFEKLTLPDGKSVRDFMSKQTFDSLSIRFRMLTGLDIRPFEKMQPIIIEAMIETMQIKNEGDSSNILMMDVALSELANERKIKTLGIETVEEQMQAILKMPVEEQVAMLVTGIDTDGPDANELYMSNDIEKIYSNTVKDMSLAAQEAMLIGRNKRMEERIEIMIKKQPTFIAVGAAHLGGPQGLVNLLKTKGYILTFID